MSAGWSSDVGRWRTRAGWSQLELARRAEVSRQALAAIESGRQVPSTKLALRLARLLGVSVERLFIADEAPVLHDVRWAQAGAPPAERRVVVGLVDGRWVSHPMSGGQAAAADGLVDVADPVTDPVAAQATVRLFGHRTTEPAVLVAGCAPLLGVLAQRALAAGVPARWIATNTSHALQLLEHGLVHIAGVHGPDGDDPIADGRFGVPARRVRLAVWHQGLLVARGNPLGIADAADLALRGFRYSRREPGASVRTVADRLMADAGAVPPPGPDARSHEEVAAQVRWGAADGGVAIESVALQAGLGFLPIVEEPFDLVIPERHAALPAVAAFAEIVGSAAFRREAAIIPGYDCTHAGDLVDAAA